MRYSTGAEVIETNMGERVRAIRLSTGKSIIDFHRWLAEQGVAVGYSTWKNYEKGYAMYWHTARQLCELFPIDMDYIYRETAGSQKILRHLNELARVIEAQKQEQEQLVKEQDQLIKDRDRLIKEKENLIKEKENLIRKKERVIQGVS